MRAILGGLVIWGLALPALAGPEQYLLEAERSTVGFTYTMGETRDDGTMPVRAAELLIDLDAPENSRVDVTVDAQAARTGFFVVTEALRGPGGLDTANHPTLRFRSTRVVPVGDGARIEGEFTIRGVTRPGILSAQIYRQEGTEAGDRDRLSIYLTGAVSRSDFGVVGYPGMIGDLVELRILARIRRGGP